MGRGNIFCVSICSSSVPFLAVRVTYQAFAHSTISVYFAAANSASCIYGWLG
jgi:hypothetical protein